MNMEEKNIHQNTIEGTEIEIIFADWWKLFKQQNKVQRKVAFTLKALQNLTSDPSKSKKFTCENVNIFILFLEAFALQDVELNPQIKNELIMKYFGEEDNDIIKNIRKCYMHRDEKIVLDAKYIQNFVFKGTSKRVDVGQFFESLTNYVQSIFNKFVGKKNVISIDLSKIINMNTTKPTKNEVKNPFLDIIYKMLQHASKTNLKHEEQEEIMFHFIVNIVPLTDDDFNSEDLKTLKGIRNQLVHNFHKYDGLHSRLIDLTQNLHKNRNQLFIFYCANKFYDWLLNIKPKQDSKTVEVNVLNIMKSFEDIINDLGLTFDIRSVFQNEILLEFLVSRFVKKGRGKIILENEYFIYMINRKLMNVSDAAPFLTKLMVVTNNCDAIDPDDLKTLVRSTLGRQEFRFVEHLNDFWYLENNFDLVIDILNFEPKSNLKLEAAWVISKIMYMSIEPTSYFINKEIIEAGPLPILLDILNLPVHQINSFFFSNTAAIIMKLSIGENSLKQDIIDCGFLPKIIPLLRHVDVEVLESTLHALRVISSGSDEQKQVILDHQAMTHIPALLSHSKQIVHENAIRLLAIISRGNRYQKDAIIQAGVLPKLSEFLNIHETDVTDDVRFLVSNLTDCGNDQKQRIIDCGFVPKLIAMLDHVNEYVIDVALYAVGNIVRGSDEQKQFVLDCNALDYLSALLSHSKDTIRKKAITFLVNISAGNQFQKDAIIQSGLLPMLKKLLNLNQTNITMLKRTARVITNIAAGENLQKQEIIDCGFVPKLIQLLSHDNEDVIDAALAFVVNIANGSDEQRQLLLDHNALGYLPALLPHSKDNIQEKVIALLYLITVHQIQNKAVTQAGLLPMLKEFININQTNTTILKKAVEIINNLAQGKNKQKIVECGFVPELIALLAHVDEDVVDTALTAAGNIAEGSDDQKQALLDDQVLTYIPALLSHSNEVIRENAIKFLLNIAAGNQLQKETVIQAGLLPMLKELLNIHQTNITILKGTAQVINNLAAGENDLKQQIINCGFVPKLIPLLSHDNEDVIDAALAGAVNIARGFASGQVLLDHNVLHNVSDLLFHSNEVIRENAIKFLSNISAGNQSQKEAVMLVLPKLKEFLNINKTSITILSETAGVIANIADGENIQKIIDCDFVPELIAMLSNVNEDVIEAALGAVVNIFDGSVEHPTQLSLIDHEALNKIRTVLSHEKQIIRERALMFLCNITVNQSQNEAIIEAGLLPKIIELLSCGEFHIQKEATFVIDNLTDYGSEDQVKKVIEEGAIPALCDFLSCEDEDILDILLNCLRTMLLKTNHYAAQTIKENNGWKKIGRLTFHNDDLIKMLAYRIIRIIDHFNF